MEPNPKPSQGPKTLTLTLTHKKPRPKTKEVSSRYLSTPSTTARSSSSSPYLTNPRPDRFPDENAAPAPSETLARRKIKLFPDNASVQTPQTLLRECPFRSNDDIGFSGAAAAATRSFDWGRERKEEFEAPSLCRSSMRSDGQRHSFDASKDVGRPFAAALKALRPPNGKAAGAEARRERKGMKREEDVHSLRLLECRHLQLRFANAKARVVDCNRRMAAEKSVYNVSCKLRELQDSVMAKRIELEQLRRIKSLSTIVEAQMPYLDEWTCLEEEYLSSLSGATEALQNASSQIPIVESVKADTGELTEVIHSAVIMLDAVSPCVDKFLTKAEGIENVTSELAKVISIEKAMIEESGNLLSMAHELQVKECSLRSQLIQAKQRSDK